MLVRYSFLFLCLMSSSLYANQWQLSKQEKGIDVFVKDSKTSALDSFKGVVTIPASLTSLVTVLDDTKAYTRLLHDCKKAQVIKEIGNNQAIKYIVTNMPWPVKDRDMVVQSVLTQNKQTKQVVIAMKATPKLLAISPNKVRIKNMTGRWILKPVNKTSTVVTYEMNVDPGGSLPKWLVNTIAVDIPFFTLENLRTLVKQEKYQNISMPNVLNY